MEQEGSTKLITKEEFAEAITEVMHDYMPGSYAERDIDYGVEYDSEKDEYQILDVESNVRQRFRVSFQVEEVA